MDRYEAMKIFVRVAELESFTQAADSLGLPKATVSTSVQNLEALVDTKLLNRTTRRVQLTPDGANFLERCKDLLSEMDETESMFRSHSAQIKGKIRVDMTVPTAREFFIPLLPQFLELHPHIEVEVSSTDRKVDLIREGIDCVIRSGPTTDPGLVAKEIGTCATVNCVSPGYIEKFGKPKSLEDLKNHRLIYFTQVLGTKPEGFEYFDGEKYREVRMAGTLTVNNVDSYTAAGLAGLGILQSPMIGIERHLKSGALIEVLPKLKAAPMKFYLVYVNRRLLSKRVRVFMDWLEPELKKYIG